MGGTLSQLVSIGFYPILTRLYKPDEFGTFGFLMSLSQVLAILGSGQYYMAIPFGRNEDEKRDIYTLSLYLTLTSFLLLLLVFVCLYGMGFVDLSYGLIPFLSFSYILNDLHKTWGVGRDFHGLNSVLLNFNRISSNIFKLFGKTFWILCFSEIFANLLTVFGYLRKSRSDVRRFDEFKPRIKPLLLKYKNFPTFYSIYTLALILSSEAFIIFIKDKYDSEEAGYFFLANKLFVQSSLMFGSIISMAIINNIVVERKTRLEVYKKIVGIFFIVLIFSILAQFIDYKLLISKIFGEKWLQFGDVVRIFLLLIPIKIFSGVFAYILVANDNIRFVSIFKTCQLGALFVLIYFGNLEFMPFLTGLVVVEYTFDLMLIAISYKKLARQ